MCTTIKSENLSPTDSKKLGIVDKWRARVLLCGGEEENSWTKKIEKHMAVLRVAYPFLTERQLRGKAWKSCGLKSVMGGIPRYGLSSKIKKEFVKQEKILRKRDSYNFSNIFQKQRVKKEKLKSEVNTKKCPFDFNSPNMNNSSSQYSGIEIPLDYSQASSSPISQTLVKTTPKTSNSSKKINRSSYKIVLTPTSEDEETLGKQNSANFSNSKNSLFSNEKNYNTLHSYVEPQNYFGLSNVEPSLKSDGNCMSQSQNQENSTTLNSNSNVLSTQDLIDERFNSQSVNLGSSVSQQLTTDTTSYPNVTVKSNSNVLTTQDLIDDQFNSQSVNLGSPVFEQLTTDTSSHPDATVNTVLDFDSSRLSKITPVKSRNVMARQKIIFEEREETHENDICTNISPRKSLNTQDLLKSAMMDESNFPESPEVNISICSERRNLDDENVGENFSNQQEFNLNSQIDNNSFFGFSDDKSQTDKDTDLFGSLLKKEIYGYQNSYKKPKLQEIFSQNNYNYLPISPFQTQDIFSQNSSQPMMLPAGTLLSNYSSEYDRAYTKSDLKPNSYRNFYSTSHNETLKSQFDQVIPPGLSMKEFFEAKDKSFKRVRSDVKRKVSKILDFLEKDVED